MSYFSTALRGINVLLNNFCCGSGFNVIVCSLNFQAYNSVPVQAIWSINYRCSNSFPYQMLFIPKWEPMAGQRRPMGPLINCLMYHLCDGCLAQQRLFVQTVKCSPWGTAHFYPPASPHDESALFRAPLITATSFLPWLTKFMLLSAPFSHLHRE